MKKLQLFLVVILLPILASADPVEKNGIYYTLDIETMTATVTNGPNRYQGNVNIPKTIWINGTTYKVTSIGVNAFGWCSELISVTIPNSVMRIALSAFANCYSLTSVTIPSSVTSIGEAAFENCSGLTSIEIPNSVTTIDYQAFYGCSSLVSITIPNSVTSIGQQAFLGCDIPEIISKIENPFDVETNTFSDNTFSNSTLYVPTGTIEKYKVTNGWKKFFFIEEGVPSGIEQTLSKTRKIKSEDGVLKIQNIKEGTPIRVYNANGTFIGSTISQNEQAIIDTNMQPGSVAIIKIGEQSTKVIIK